MKNLINFFRNLILITFYSKEYLLVFIVFVLSFVSSILEYYVFTNVSLSINQIIDLKSSISLKILFLIPFILILRSLTKLTIFRLGFTLAGRIATSLYSSLLILKGKDFINSNLKNNRDDISIITIGIRTFLNSIIAISDLLSILGLGLLITIRFQSYLSFRQIILFIFFITFFSLINILIIKYQTRLQKQIKIYTDVIFNFCSNISIVSPYTSSSVELQKSFAKLFSQSQINLRNKQTIDSSMNFLPSSIYEFVFYSVLLLISFLASNTLINNISSNFTTKMGIDITFLLIFITRISSIQARLSACFKSMSAAYSYNKIIVKKFIQFTNSNKKKLSYKNYKGLTKNENIIFHYKDYKINFKSLKNQHIFIKGISGSGKSSIINKILACEDISFYNKEYLDLAESSKLFTYINDKCFLIPGSILDNILLGTNLSFHNRNKIENSFKYSQIYKIFELDNDGDFENLINLLSLRKIDGLSSGEKQRINIARSILFGGPFLLFDEGTSNLTNQDHKIIINYLISSHNFLSSIVISHQDYLPESFRNNNVLKIEL